MCQMQQLLKIGHFNSSYFSSWCLKYPPDPKGLGVEPQRLKDK